MGALPNRLLRQREELPVPEGRESFLPAGAGPCWSWTGATNNAGYGQYKYRDRVWGVHRLAYHLCVAPLARPGRAMARGDDYIVVDHLCERRSCFNPLHLEGKTQSDNVKAGARHRTKESPK